MGKRRAHHNGTRASDDDARAVLGQRGITRFGVAYAWCERERAYHRCSPMTDVERERIDRSAQLRNGRYVGRAHAIARFSDRTRQPQRALRIARIGQHVGTYARLAWTDASARGGPMRAFA
jgi:hypothetical protein